MSSLLDRFLRYVTVPSNADPDGGGTPSSPGQWEMARLLAREMEAMGLDAVTVDAHGYVTAALPSNLPEADVPVVGLIAHIDTSPAVTDRSVSPRVVLYEGGDIVLDGEGLFRLSPSEFPELERYRGQELVVTDGRTLLGADDKAGVAEILSALDYLKAHPEIPRATVRVAFTPDEEIGHGAELLDLETFGADFAYTVDGGPLGELSFETFNAARAVVTIRGRSVHPGTAKGTMINALLVGTALVASLPADETPARTEGRQGFFHVERFCGDVERAELEILVRDHDGERFLRRKERLRREVEAASAASGAAIELDLADQYRNMAPLFDGDRQVIVDLARRAMAAAGVEAREMPVRGGTDGARLSFRGLLTPNLFTGGHNFHGRHEYIPVPSMEKALQVLVNLISLAASVGRAHRFPGKGGGSVALDADGGGRPSENERVAPSGADPAEG
ncbi:MULTISPECIES: peptidase T [Synergistales]|uniref:peptidase T n=1 Tax=Synergistales TaxID=649776 RepID=UPI002368BC7C|nr:peptidase T [Aminithiophilus ramosus]